MGSPSSGTRDALRGTRVARLAVRALAGMALVFSASLVPRPAFPQGVSTDSSALFKGLDLETAGKNREAATYFRSALRTTSAVSALLGLERVYNELGWADSLVAPVDSLIARDPREPVFRSVQLRTLQTLGREADLRKAFERWAHDVPSDPAPYREYARILLERNQAQTADTVLRRAGQSLGSTRDLELEIAQLRAATGQWVESAKAWRLALSGSPFLEQAAVYALAPMPAASRLEVKAVLLAPPVDAASRKALADLEMGWGAPAEGWEALRELPADSESVAAWLDFASRAEAEERWSLARDALVSALKWKNTSEVAVRAATAALNAGDPSAVPVLAPVSGANGDSAVIGKLYVPLYARAYAMLGRPSDAERLVQRFDSWIPPLIRPQLVRSIAWGWVRSGDMAHARAALASVGAEGDSSDAAGWLALYDGNLKSARQLLRAGSEASPDLALALGLIARLRADTAAELGRAFLTLARGDSAKAAVAFESCAERYPEGASLLLETAARLHLALHDETAAMSLWKRIVTEQGATPEAPQAELEWARALRAKGDNAGAVARLEHLILTYPQSALVPQARHELEIARGSVPGNS